jgi:hypothetical protein
VKVLQPPCYGLDLKYPSKAQVLEPWFPMQQCSEVGLWEGSGSGGL